MIEMDEASKITLRLHVEFYLIKLDVYQLYVYQKW